MATKVEAGKKTRKQAAQSKRPSLRQELGITSETEKRPRRLRLPSYRPFRFKRVKYPERLPSGWKLTASTVSVLWYRRGLFLGIAAVYAALIMIFVQGFSGGADVTSLKNGLTIAFGGKPDQLLTSITVLASLFTGAGVDTSGNPSAGAYKLIVGLIISLAAIWAVRQTTAGARVSVRDAFYKGVYPLVPFALVLFVVVLETLPLLIGAWLFTTVVSTGVAANILERVLWGSGFAVGALVSVYMLCSSVFALYIVTLPNMTPMKALKSARQLVRYRRGQILRKVLFAAVLLLVAASAIMLPLIVFVPVVAQWVFFALTMIGLVVVHAYMYTLYKALLA